MKSSTKASRQARKRRWIATRRIAALHRRTRRGDLTAGRMEICADRVRIERRRKKQRRKSLARESLHEYGTALEHLLLVTRAQRRPQPEEALRARLRIHHARKACGRQRMFLFVP